MTKEPSMAKWSILREYLSFLKTHKKWWLLPVVLILIILGLIIILAQGSALAPFIYTLF